MGAIGAVCLGVFVTRRRIESSPLAANTQAVRAPSIEFNPVPPRQPAMIAVSMVAAPRGLQPAPSEPSDVSVRVEAAHCENARK
jgi:hypothetical protein